MASTSTPDEFVEILAPTKSYYADYKVYLKIVDDFQSTRKNLRNQGCQMKVENFHTNIAQNLLIKLVKEVEEAFDVSDFPIIDAFHSFDPRNLLATAEPSYGLDVAKRIYDFYGYNKVDIFQGQRNEVAAVITCGEESFLQQCATYFQLLIKKKAEKLAEYESKKTYLLAKYKEQEKKKKCLSKTLKATKKSLKMYQLK